VVDLNTWIELKIPIDPDIEDAVSNFLFEIGSSGNYQIENTLHAYFTLKNWNDEKDQFLKNYLEELSQLGFHINKSKIQYKEIKDQDWNALWKKSLTPIYIDNDLIIKPSWTELNTATNTLVIEIDPQMAFGTGVHATTQLMLKLLKSYVKPYQKVLDIGTGSGILAITAAKMGTYPTFAFDIDPVATLTAKQNILKNNTSKNTFLFSGTIDSIIDYKFDLILANINRTIILKMLESIVNMLNADGLAVFSGILNSEQKIIFEALKHNNFTILRYLQQDEWLGIVSKLSIQTKS
jgi:ribosomal protein L11 methyltransferase